MTMTTPLTILSHFTSSDKRINAKKKSSFSSENGSAVDVKTTRSGKDERKRLLNERSSVSCLKPSEHRQRKRGRKGRKLCMQMRSSRPV